MIPLRFSGFTIFQPTRPLRGATGGQGGILSLSPYFNPRAPCGARPWAPWNLLSLSAEFQPTRPLRGATVKLWPWIVRRNISTHAPLAGRDDDSYIIRYEMELFQPTRPLRGATRSSPFWLRGLDSFQPTRPLRGATQNGLDLRYSMSYFNPRAPCGARHKDNCAKGAETEISTHAPLAGRDLFRSGHFPKPRDFNPRAPCGARRIGFPQRMPMCGFQPTRPLRGATQAVV